MGAFLTKVMRECKKCKSYIQKRISPKKETIKDVAEKIRDMQSKCPHQEEWVINGVCMNCFLYEDELN